MRNRASHAASNLRCFPVFQKHTTIRELPDRAEMRDEKTAAYDSSRADSRLFSRSLFTVICAATPSSTPQQLSLVARSANACTHETCAGKSIERSLSWLDFSTRNGELDGIGSQFDFKVSLEGCKGPGNGTGVHHDIAMPGFEDLPVGTDDCSEELFCMDVIAQSYI